VVAGDGGGGGARLFFLLEDKLNDGLGGHIIVVVRLGAGLGRTSRLLKQKYIKM
jgi:hypothetical protein